jgi:two-component sensor histidine kinase
MALIHELLYRSENLSDIGTAEYIEKLVMELIKSYTTKQTAVELELDLQDVPLELGEAILCGLIVNELVVNAVKYAFPPSSTRSGKIRVKFFKDKQGNVALDVSDNGIGIPESLDIHQTDSLGLKMVAMLVEDQLRGRLHVHREDGTRFEIRFPPA